MAVAELVEAPQKNNFSSLYNKLFQLSLFLQFLTQELDMKIKKLLFAALMLAAAAAYAQDPDHNHNYIGQD